MYNIETVNNYRLNKDTPRFSIFNYVLNNNFKKDNILEINCRLLYQYTNYNNIRVLLHIFKLYDNDDTMFYEYKSPIVNSGDNRRNDIKQIDTFYTTLKNDYDYIKVELILSIVENVTNNVDCKLYNAYNSNYLCIKNYRKIDSVIIENNNLGDLENTILSNSSKINNIKNLVYLKNIHNIIFYDSKTQIDFRNLFYEKVFSVDVKHNYFIEINLKMLLEYENINEKNYVNTVYEIFDGNNNSLYISTINNNDYQYFSNKVSIKENIIYNLTKNTKNIKFRIKFLMTAVKVIKVWYIENNNYRLILKHYSS